MTTNPDVDLLIEKKIRYIEKAIEAWRNRELETVNAFLLIALTLDANADGITEQGEQLIGFNEGAM